MRLLATAALGGLVAAPAAAADLNVRVELPKLEVAEYHKPYVAIWLERPDQSVAANLAVWYQVGKEKNEGNKWLKDMRQWWRKSGRDLAMPVDGLSSATRPPGTHELTFPAATPALAGLAPGDYRLVVEAARESGGREVVRVPVAWPPKEAEAGDAKGETELGAIHVELKP